MNSFRAFIDKKEVRFIIACLCCVLFSRGIMRLVEYQTKYDLVRGVGEVLLWGGWAVVNLSHPFKRKIPKINLVINIGIMVLIASWFVPLIK